VAVSSLSMARTFSRVCVGLSTNTLVSSLADRKSKTTSRRSLVNYPSEERLRLLSSANHARIPRVRWRTCACEYVKALLFRPAKHCNTAVTAVLASGASSRSVRINPNVLQTLSNQSTLFPFSNRSLPRQQHHVMPHLAAIILGAKAPHEVQESPNS
jgi:hypothetical protein